MEAENTRRGRNEASIGVKALKATARTQQTDTIDGDAQNANINNKANRNAKRSREITKNAFEYFHDSATVTADVHGAGEEDASTSGEPSCAKSKFNALTEAKMPIGMMMAAAADRAGDEGGKIGGGAILFPPTTSPHGLASILGDGINTTASPELLYQASHDGDLSQVRQLLDAGMGVDSELEIEAPQLAGHRSTAGRIPTNIVHKSGRPLLAACEQGQYAVAKLLLDRGATVDAADKDGRTALREACTKNHLDLAGLLLERGAAVDAADCAGYMPLHLACHNGHLDVARLLLDKGAAVSAADTDGYTPLHFACNLDRAKIAALLVSRGANVHALNSSGQSSLVLCRYDDLRLAPQGSTGELYRACKDGNTAEAMRLLDAGVDVNCEVMDSVDEYKKGRLSSPLHAAVTQGFSELATLLISRGADPTAKNSFGLTPLAAKQEANALRYRSVISGMIIANNSNPIAEENFYLLHWLYRIRRASCARGLLVWFLRPDFLWVIFRPMMRSSKLLRTDADIRKAARLWCDDRAAAEEQYGHISDWDVSDVTNMREVFQFQDSFNDDISRWDVSKVTNMVGMFEHAFAFNQPVGDWDVSNVTDMNHMFDRARSFNQPVGGWDVSKVTNMSSMFCSARSFNQPVGNWGVSKVTGMSQMFFEARVFNQAVGDWDVSRVTNMIRMFWNALAFNQAIGDWDVSNVRSMNHMFNSARSFNQDLTRWDMRSVRDAHNMFNNADAMQRENKPDRLR